MYQQRDRHALPPSVARRASAVSTNGEFSPPPPLTMRPARTSADAHMLGEQSPRQLSSRSGSSSDVSLLRATIEELELSYRDDDYVEPLFLEHSGRVNEARNGEVVFRENSLGVLDAASMLALHGRDEEERPRRKFSRFGSVTDAVQSVGRHVKQRLSVSWWRKDSALAANTSRQASKEDGKTDVDCAVLSSNDEVKAENSQPGSSQPHNESRNAFDGAPLTPHPDTHAGVQSLAPDSTKASESVERARTLPGLPPMPGHHHRYRRNGSAAMDIEPLALDETPDYLRPRFQADAALPMRRFSQKISQSIYEAQRSGRFDDERRERSLKHALGNNTSPFAQSKAAVSLRRMTKEDKVQRDKLFAKCKQKRDIERCLGDVPKRTWRFSFKRSKVREQQAWYHMRTMSEPATNEKSPVILNRDGGSPNPLAEAAAVVGNVMKQRAGTVGVGLTP